MAAGVLQRVSYDVNDLEKKLVRIGGGNDDESLRQELSQLHQRIVSGIEEVKKVVTKKNETAEDKIRSTKLAKELQPVAAKAKKVFTEYEKKQRDFPLQARSMTLTSIQTMGTSGSSQQQDQVTLDVAVDLETRNAELNELHGNIRDLNDITRNLATYVTDQQETIDTIEEDVVSAADHVSKGASDVEKGRELASKNRKMRIIIAAVVTGAIIAVVVIVIIIAVATACGTGNC